MNNPKEINVDQCSKNFAVPYNISHYYNLENVSFDCKPGTEIQSHHSTQNKFTCDPCNKSFFTAKMHQKHIDEHVDCPFPECNINACMKIIDQHISNWHMHFNSESLQVDNEKWIEERKKRFAYLKNKEVKKTQSLEILQRGERIGLEKKKLLKGKKSENSDFKKSKQRKKRSERGNKQKMNNNVNIRELVPSVDLYDSDNESKRGVKAFTGMNCFLESLGELPLLGVKNEDPNASDIDDQMEISDEEDWTSSAISAKNNETPFSNALGALIGAYISSDEEIESLVESKTEILAPVACSSSKNNNKILAKENELIHSATVPIVNSTENFQEFKNLNKRKNRNKNNSHKPHKPSTHKKLRKPTLLEKLLESDIRHERNVILQCIRYILNENYFEVEEEKIAEKVNDDTSN